MSNVFLLVIFCMCLTAEGMSYMKVHVNRVHLAHVSINKTYSYKKKSVTCSYYYVSGNMADVWCLKMRANCSLQLHYEFDNDSIGGNGQKTAKTAATDAMLGLRTILRAEHNGKRLICDCYDHPNRYTIIVKLIQNLPNHSLVLKGFNTTILYDQLQGTSDSTSGSYAIQLAYKRDEHIKLTCDSTDKDVRIQICYDYSNKGCIRDSKINVRPDDDGKTVRCEAKKNGAIIRSVKVLFNNGLSTLLNDETPLNVNVDNSLLELYENKGNRTIYYDYIDGETPTINCSTSQNFIYMHNTASLVLSDTVSRPGLNYVDKQIRLTPGLNRTTINCDLYDGNQQALRHAEVLLRLKTGHSMPPKAYGDISKSTSQGSSITIRCTVIGTPQPTISWQFIAEDGTHFVSIPGSKNQLHLPSIEEKDAGIYKCIAQNDLGTSEHNTTVTVQVPPKATGIDTINAPTGSNVTIQCSVTGTPQPKISWQFKAKDSAIFDPISKDGSMISIMNVDEKHAGLYKCSAWNNLAIDEHTTELIVQEVEDRKWIIVAGSGVGCIVIAVVLAAVCFMKRSKLPAQTSPAVDETPIPLHPPQWDAVPVDQLEDPTYSVPWTQKTETYKTAGSTSQKEGTENELTYADLYIACLNRGRNGPAPKRFIIDDSPYAEVSPDYVRLRDN